MDGYVEMFLLRATGVTGQSQTRLLSLHAAEAPQFVSYNTTDISNLIGNYIRRDTYRSF